jgi:hypothetical protein
LTGPVVERIRSSGSRTSPRSGTSSPAVIDVLTPEQLSQLSTIADAILNSVDAEGSMTDVYHRYDARS